MNILLDNNFNNIDRRATKKTVESFLGKVRLYKQLGFIRKEANSTPSYEPRLHGKTSNIYKSTEEVATKNIHNEQKIMEMFNEVNDALNKLDDKEKEIIRRRYLESDDIFDYEVYNDLNLSERKYYRVKAKAIIKLAIILSIEIYQSEEVL